jgi:Tol biopolymer transport system component
MDVTRGTRNRLTFGGGNYNPVWSPDGKWVAYYTLTKGGPAIVRRQAVGGPEETMLSAQDIRPADWSTDGKYLLYTKGPVATSTEIWALPLASDGKPFQVVPPVGYINSGARLSPDMRWLAYWSDESGRHEIYIVPFHGSGKWQVSLSGGDSPHWRNDGKELFFLSLNSVLMAVPVAAEGGELKLGAPQALFRVGPTQFDLRNYDVAPGGQQFLISFSADQGLKPITLVTNWTAELKK